MDASGLQWALGLAVTVLLAALGTLRAMIGTKLSTADFDREIASMRERARVMEERAERMRDDLDDRVRRAELAALWDAHGQIQKQVSGLEARMSEMAETMRGTNRILDDMRPDVKEILKKMGEISARAEVEGGRR